MKQSPLPRVQEMQVTGRAVKQPVGRSEVLLEAQELFYRRNATQTMADLTNGCTMV